MGQENFPHHVGRGGDSIRQNHAGRGKDPILQTHPASLPSPQG